MIVTVEHVRELDNKNKNLFVRLRCVFLYFFVITILSLTEFHNRKRETTLRGRKRNRSKSPSRLTRKKRNKGKEEMSNRDGETGLQRQLFVRFSSSRQNGERHDQQNAHRGCKKKHSNSPSDPNKRKASLFHYLSFFSSPSLSGSSKTDPRFKYNFDHFSPSLSITPSNSLPASPQAATPDIGTSTRASTSKRKRK